MAYLGRESTEVRTEGWGVQGRWVERELRPEGEEMSRGAYLKLQLAKE